MTLSGVTTRTFATGTVEFSVACPDEESRGIVENLFVDLPEGGAVEESEIFEIVRRDQDWGIEVPSGRSVRPQSVNGALTTLVTSVSRLALDNDPDRLHLHCAALQHPTGTGVLISAPPGTGKTTLAAALIHRDWSYLSDEAVALDNDSSLVHGFAKPLTIKPGGGPLVPFLEPARLVPREGDQWWHVPVSSVTDKLVDSIEPSVVVILRRDVEPFGSALVPVHPVDAVVALLDQTMDAGRYGTGTLEKLARLAARSRCVVVTVHDVDAMAGEIERLALERAEALPVVELAPEASLNTDGWTVNENTRSMLIGDRVVAHQTFSGAILALDDAASAAWLALFGRAPEWWPSEAVRAPSTISFFEELQMHGVLDRTGENEGSTK